MLRKLLQKRRESGFTVPELLVVATLMILLAVIAIPILSSQRSKVDEGRLKSDLVNAAMNIDEAKVDNGGKYPSALPSEVKLTSDNAVVRYTYPYDRLEYCLQIISGETTLFKSSKSAEITTTDCTYEFVVPSTKLSGRMKGFDPVLSWNTVANATSYVLYKNNIPVKTVTFATGSTAKTASYTLPRMNPLEEATFHVVVADGGNQSAQSNSVRLKAPIPTPTKPEIKLVSKNVKDSTTMNFNIGWTAVKYAQGYELYDVTGTTPVKIQTLSESSGSYKYESPRGTIRKLVLRSVNDAGISGDSNILTLSSAWDPAKIVSAKSDPATGKISFVFHEDVDGTITPDYGWPTSSIRLKITEVTTGSLVLDVSGLNTMTYTNAKSFNRVQHRATIIVTTSTGEVLSESAPVVIDFPKPTTPSIPTNFTSTNGGDADITPNRLKWSNVTCSPSSTPEYNIEHDGFNSGWVTGTSFNIPASWLAEGAQETFKIKARCVNSNGNSGESGQSSTIFTTGLSTPATPVNLTVANRANIGSWAAVTCATGSTAEYGVTQNIRNSENTSFAFSPIKTTSYAFPSLVGGSDHNFSVAARCVQYDGSGAVKASSSWSPYSGFYEWQTKFSAPVTPILTEVSKTYTSSTNVEFRVRWNADQWGRSYELFDASNNRSLGVIAGGVLETVVNGTRGKDLNVYLVASNPDHKSPNSATLSLKDTWAKTAILETTADPYTGSINVVWQKTDQAGKTTPDWGSPDSRVELVFTDTVTGESVSYENLSGDNYSSDELLRNPQKVTLTVRTSTGVNLNPPATKIVDFPKPGPPAKVTGVRYTSDGEAGVTPNQIAWQDVNCGPATPEYLITDANSGNSGWVEGIVSEADILFNPDASWLRQGFTENFTIAARCKNPAGVSASSEAVSTSVVINVNTPEELNTLSNNKIDTVKWSHAEVPSGLTREYLVSTKTYNGTVSTKTYTTPNASYVIPTLLPNTNQIVDVQVRFYNAATGKSSAWSDAATTTWITPKPIPGIPVIKLDSSTILNSTTQRYTLSWAATTWAEGYRVVNNANGSILATVTTPTANIDLKRGIAETNVSVEAYNTSATSTRSNDIGLEAPWETPVINSLTANRNGTISMAWQTGAVATPTPNWGAPDSRVKVEIRTESEEGVVAYTVSGLNAINHTTTAFANTSVKRDEDYYVQISVTTSTGLVLKSDWVEANFERPNSPAYVSNIRIDGSGVTTLPQDRVLWNAVTCTTQSNTAPEYWVGYVPSDLDDATEISDEATMAMNWTKNVTSFNIPAAKLLSIQGEDLALIVLSRCVFTDNNDASEAKPAIVGGSGYIEVNIGVAPPTKNAGTPTRASLLNNTINWTAAVCDSTSTPEYKILKNVHNGVASTTTYSTEAITYALPSITAGANQSVQVQARCVLTSNDTKVSSWSAYSLSYAYRAPLAKPAAPVIKSSGITYTSDTAGRYTASWVAVANAENYLVYDGTTLLATLPSNALTHNIDVVRGSAAAKKITVKATNFSYGATAVTASNILTLAAPWPSAVIDSVTANQSRQLTVVWQTGTGVTRDPNWGNNASKVQVIVMEGTTSRYNVSGLLTNSVVTPTLAGTGSKFEVTIKVTTANGEILTSPVVVATLNPPLKPTTTMVVSSSNSGVGPVFKNYLTWPHVTCPVAGSTPEYLINHTDATFGNMTGTWSAANSYVIPQAWLEEGVDQSFSAYARCTSINGDSPNSTVVTHSFRTNVPTPAIVTGLTLDSNNDDGTASLSWNAVACPAHLDNGYLLVYDKKNDTAYANFAASQSAYAYAHAYGNTSVDVSGLNLGDAHSAYVIARCYDAANTAITSQWANATKSTSVAWTTPIPVPVAPTLTASAVGTDPANEKQTRGTLTWNMPTHTARVFLYSSTGTQLGIYTNTSTIRYITRGTSSSFYVVAENAQGIKGARSANATIASVWPNVVLSQTGFSTTTGSWGGKWGTAAQNPDWGTGATFNFVVKNAAGTVIENTTGLAYTTTARTIDLPDVPSKYSMTATVITTTGVAKASNTIQVNYVPPPVAAPTGLTSNSHTGIKWSAVSCKAGSTPYYWITWTTKNGAAASSTYATTSTSYAIPGMVPDTLQRFEVKALCRTTAYGDSIYSASSAVAFTSYYAIPTSVPAPTNTDLNSGGPTNKTEHDRLSWTHATCPTGSTRSYTVNWTHKDGVQGATPYYTRTGITVNYYDLTTTQQQQGSRTSWNVETDCKVTLGTGSSSGNYSGWHVSVIAEPSGTVNMGNNGWMTVTYNPSMTCPDAGTVLRSRWRVTIINSADVVNYWTGWGTDVDGSKGWTSVVPEANYGYKHGGYVSLACVYNNDDGVTSFSPDKSGEVTYWTAKIASPEITNFVADRSLKNAKFTLFCPRGTYLKYWWEAKSSTGAVLNSNSAQSQPTIINTRAGNDVAVTVPWTTGSYVAKWRMAGGWCESDIIAISPVIYPEWNTIG